MWRMTGWVLNRLWLLAALLIIALAILVAAGRELLPVASRYQTELNAWLSARAGLAISTESLRGEWSGLSPRLTARGLVIADPASGETAITVERATAELDLLQSLATLSPVWEGLVVENARATLVEDGNGAWWLAGHPLAGGDGRALAYLRKALFATGYLRLDGATLDLRFYSGTVATARAPEVRIDNGGGFHRTLARVALGDDGAEAARIIIEGTGAGGDFAGSGFVQLKRLGLDPNLGAIARRWFPEQAARVGDIDTDIDLSLWFDWRDGSLVNGRGTLAAAEIPLAWVADAGSLRNVAAEVTAWYQPGEDWGLRLQNLRGDWGAEALPPLSLEFRQRVGRRWGELDLRVDRLDLAATHQLLARTDLLGERLAAVLAELNLRGAIAPLLIDLDLSGERPGVAVSGNLRDVALDAWRGAPAARHVNGYFAARNTASGLAGLVELDSPEGFAMHYPQVYEDFMPYGAVRGRLDWQWFRDSHRVRVNSGPIAIAGEEGRGTAHLSLDLPTRKGAFEPEMNLMVALRDSDARFVDRYLPKVLKPELARWLDRAIGTGRIPEAGFIWRGSLMKANHRGRTLQVYARVADATLDYQPGWPALGEVSATLLVDDTAVDVWADGGLAGAAVIDSARARLRPDPAGGSLLRVSGALRADAGEGLAILLASPVGKRLDALRPWQLSGASAVALDLAIPLGAPRERQRYDVAVTLADGHLTLPGSAVDIEAIAGDISYSLAGGLAADALTGRFRGQPLTGTIASDGEGTRVNLAGEFSAADFAEFLNGHAGRLTGTTPVTATLLIPAARGEPPSLGLDSDLEGIAIDLPAPFGKGADEGRPVTARLEFEGDLIRAEARMAALLAARWQLRDGEFRRGAIDLSGNVPPLPLGRGLVIGGTLPRLDWSEWRDLLAEGGGAPEGLQTYHPSLDLDIGELLLENVNLGETSLAGTLERDNRWRLRIDSAQVAGEVLTGGERTTLRLDYLHLPKLREDADAAPVEAGAVAEGDEAEGYLDRLSPRDIPALDFAAERITLGERELGSLAFLSSPVPDGVRFDAIAGTLRGISLASGEGAEPAELEWRERDGVHHSRFTGTLSLADFAATLENWSLPRVLDSKDAAFHLELAWAERPWEFSAAILDGHIGIDLEDGQFNRATGVPTNTFLRLVSLLNFDTWLRRLRFDFTDLFNQGVSFDQLRGGLAFERGTLRFDEPIVAAMPSGKIRLLGSADIVNEQLDARLVATLPVGTNLPWVAGVLGGLPAAAGVYLTGKLFKKQVDQLSSLSYRVTGSWDDPDLEVDKIFSDKTDLEEPRQ